MNRAWVLRPHTIISAVIGLGLLGAVLALGNPAKAWDLMTQAGWPAVVLVVALTLPYLAARGLVWRRLLAQQGARVPLLAFLMAFAAGEFAKDLPGGEYVEDYLLSRCGVPAAKSVTATTALSALETLLALPLVLAWGIPGWTWLPLALGAILFAYVVVIVGLWWLTNPRGVAARLSRPRALQPALRGVRDVLLEARRLVAWRTLRDNLPLTIVYFGIVVSDLYLLGRTISVPGFGVREAAVVFGFTTLSFVLIPIPTSLGVTEASGAEAMVAFGASPAQAVAVLLLLRILLTGSTMLFTGLVLVALWRRTRQEVPATSSLQDNAACS